MTRRTDSGGANKVVERVGLVDEYLRRRKGNLSQVARDGQAPQRRVAAPIAAGGEADEGVHQEDVAVLARQQLIGWGRSGTEGTAWER